MSVVRKRNIKFLTLYNSFTETEKIEFSKFIKTGLNGNKRNYSKILSSLIIDKNGIVEISETESSRTRWNRLSELSLLADKFLIFKSKESDRFENKYLLLKEYDKRNLSSLYEHSYKSLIKEIKKEHVKNYDYNIIYKMDKIYLNQFKTTSDPKKFVKKLTQSNNLRAGTYLIELLEQLIEMWNKRAAGILNSKTLDEEIFESLDFEKILLLFSKNSGSKDVSYHIIKYLYLIYLSLISPKKNDNYNKAKRIFFRELKSISKEKRTKFYNYMMELILERANLGIKGAAEELFFILNKKLKEGLTDDIERKDLPVNKFRDYILTAIVLGKYKWANNFINKYGSLLHEDVRNDYVLLGKAFVTMHSGEFIICKELLSRIKMKNPFFHVDVSILKLKFLFELKNFDECYDELKRFNEYLRRERIIQDHLSVYAKAFCSAFSLLLKLNRNNNMNNLNDLQFLLSGKDLIGKKWIIKKMKDMIPVNHNS
jgi:hypothetical protein